MSSTRMDSIDRKRDVEANVTDYQGGAFPDELPARSAPPPAASTWKRRLRTLFTFSPSSFNLFNTHDGQVCDFDPLSPWELD